MTTPEQPTAVEAKHIAQKLVQDAYNLFNSPITARGNMLVDAIAAELSSALARATSAEASLAKMREALEEGAGRLEGFAPRTDAGVIEVVARVLLNIASDLRRAARASATPPAATEADAKAIRKAAEDWIVTQSGLAPSFINADERKFATDAYAAGYRAASGLARDEEGERK